jgi:hypothetical protein
MPFSPLEYRRYLGLEIKNGDKGYFKVVWQQSEYAPFAPYNIDEDMVQKDAAEIRQKLDALVDVLMKDPTTPCGSQLKDLARAGRELYNDLFQVGVRGSEVDSAVVRSWLQGKLEPHRLSVVVDTYVHVPWGLVFDGDPELIPDDAFDIESYKDFWCLKFLLSCSYKGLDPSIAEHGERSNEFRLVPVLHQGEYDLSKWKVDDPEGVAFNKVLEEFGGGISDFKSLMSAWAVAAQANKILFFYCHANGTTLAISPAESISSDDLKRKLRSQDGKRSSSAALTFLNGCSTAVGKGDSKGFIEATTREGFCGFIGTETDIPNVYALRFGAAFIHGMLDTGWPVLDVMDAMRRSHWPLSLLYQIYGSSTFRVVRSPVATTWPSESTPSFSLGPIGAKSL